MNFNEKISGRILFVLLASLPVVLIYLKSIQFGFTNFDDTLLIVEQEAFFKESGSVLKSFTNDVFISKINNDVYYRPVLTISFIIDYYLGGLNPRMYHISNLVYFILAMILLFLTLNTVLNNKPFASFVLVFLYSLNPIFTSTVCWIPGRNDSMLSIFVLSSFLSLIKYQKSKGIIWFILHALAFMLALFTKENAITIAVIFTAYVFLFHKEDIFKKAGFSLYALWSVGVVFFLYMRNIGLVHPPDFQFNVLESVAKNWFSIPHYLGKFFTTTELSPIPLVIDMNWVVGLTGLIILSLLFYFSKNKPLSLFGIVWFAVLLLPGIAFTNPMLDFNYHFEHRTHTAFAGILLMFIPFLDSDNPLYKRRLFIYPCLVAIAAFFSFRSYNYSEVFRDGLSFFTASVKQSPHCSNCWALLGNESFENGKTEQAIEAYNQAISYNPKTSEYYTNLAKIYLHSNQMNQAGSMIEALYNNPDIDPFLKNMELARFYLDFKDFENAKKHLLQAEQLKPDDVLVKRMKEYLFGGNSN